MRRYDEALKEFKLDTRRYGESSDLALGKGMAQMGMRRAAEALKFVERAIRLRPENARAWYEKGKLLKKLGNEAEAQAAFAESERLGGKFDESGPYWPY
jgi:Flp pilus assembly protein TadD